jgi:hypothetical protein
MASVVVNGDTSGAVTLSAPAVAGTVTVTLPAASGMMAVLPTATGVLAESAGGTGTTTGYYGFKNRLINSAMDIDQRNAGASITVTTGVDYVVDRFFAQGSITSKFTAQQSSTVPTGFKNSLLFTSSAATTPGASDYYYFSQNIEGLNVYDLAWGTASAATVTLSFWVRSSLTGTFSGAVLNDATNRSYAFTYTINSANTFEQKTITIAGDTSGTWLTTNGIGIRLRFALGAGSNFLQTAGSWGTGNVVGATGTTQWISTSGATFYVTGVQLEKGSTATSFDYLDYGRSLIQCQRYFQNLNKDYMPFNVPLFNGQSNTIWAFTFPVIMRAGPTLTYSGNTTILYFNSAGGVQQSATLTSISGGYNSTLGGARIYHTLLGQSGLTGFIEIGGGTGSFAFSSEL